MAKQLNVQMNVNANTQSAQAEVKKLQQILHQAISEAGKTNGSLKITKEIQEATKAAARLQAQLEAALNPQTGNLDLSKFSQQLAKSKTTIQQYSAQLLNLGPTGEKAFMQMANAIIKAEVPMRRSSALMSNLWTTMKNTARWQLSSSALHAFMGTLQSAYGYAKDLNESLNNIRIVTGQSVNDMARFAEEANKAAKALSTTTTAYTDAALIYYQQGLSDAEVKARTDVTIKLANVSRQSAEEVSSQMTAIWNNFYDGSKSLEYYADVITKLGASTASSSQEISAGLQKFAAVADTVGLSYEKASAALATVVAETRQSADVVGTAFKTMFARFQGLSLGETLEDGVDLNKYSKALQTVGVNILDANGQLKRMDDILDETADKWTKISEAQRVALAETVAGTRQYAQFMAIMNNYNKIEKNEDLALYSEGAVQEQQDTFAEGWEAAGKRARAAAEGIYNELLNDKFFISLENSLTGLLTGVDKLIHAFGGLPGVLSLVGTIATNVFGQQITAGIERSIQNLKVFTGIAETEGENVKRQLKASLDEIIQDNPAESALGLSAQVQRDNLELYEQLRQKREQMTEEEAAYYQQMIQVADGYGQQAIAAREAAEAADELQRKKGLELNTKAAHHVIETVGTTKSTGDAAQDQANADAAKQLVADTLDQLGPLRERFEAAVKSAYDYEKVIKDIQETGEKGVGVSPEQITQLSESYQALSKSGNSLSKGQQDVFEKLQAVQKAAKGTQQYDDAVKELTKSIADNASELTDHQRAIAVEAAGYAEISGDLNLTARDYAEFGEVIWNTNEKQDEAAAAAKRHAEQIKELNKAIQEASVGGVTQSFAQGLTTTFQGVSQLAMGINSLRGAFDALNNTDMGFGEKMLSVMTSLGMGIPMLVTGLQKLTSAEGLFSGKIKENLMLLLAKKAGITAASLETRKYTLTELRQLAASNALIATEGGLMIATHGVTAAKKAGNTVTLKQIALNFLLKASMAELIAVILAIVAAVALLTAGFIWLFNSIKNNSLEGKLANAKAGTEAAAKAAEEAKNAYNDFLGVFDKYKGAVDKINKLTKGTDEFKQAVEEANEAARELIRTYSITKFKVNSNGVIELDPDQLEEQKKTYANRVEQTAAVQVGAENYQRKAEDAINRRDLMTRARAFSGMTQYTEGGSYNTNTELTADNILKAQRALNTTDFTGQTKESIVAAMGEGWEGQLTAAQEDFINTLLKSGNALSKFGDALLHNADATEAATKAQLAADLADEDAFINSENQTAILNAQMKKKDSIDSDIDKKLSSMSMEQIYKEYEKAMGYASHGVGTWLDGKETFYDANGEKVADLTDEQVKEYYKAMLEADEMEKNALEETIKALDETISKSGDSGNIVSAALSGDTSGLKLSQLASENNEDLLNSIDTSKFKELGYESAEEMAKAMSDVLTKAQGEWNDTLIKYPESVKNAVNGIAQEADTAFQNISRVTLETYGDSLEKLYASGGSEAVDKISSGLTTIMEKNAGKAEEIMQAASGIDWSQEDAVDQLNLKLRDMGVYIDKSSSEWQSLVSGFANVNIAFKPTDLTTMRTQLTDLQKLAKDIKTGSIISDDDFKKILEIKPELRDLFVTTAEGMAYIGDQDLSKTVEDMKLADLQKEMDKNAAAKAAVEISNQWGSDRGNGWEHHNDEWTRNVNNDEWLLGTGTNENGKEDHGTIGNLLANQEALEQFANATGRDVEKITQDFELLTDAQADVNSQDYKDAKARAQEFFNDLGKLESDVTNGLYDNKDALQLFATSFDDYDKMVEAINKLDISDGEKKELIDTAGIVVAQNEVEKLQGLLDKLVGKKYEIGTEIDSSQLQSFAELGIDVGDYFTDLGNGASLMIGDGEELQTKLESAYLTPMQNTVEKLQAEKEKWETDYQEANDELMNAQGWAAQFYLDRMAYDSAQATKATEALAEAQEKLSWGNMALQAQRYGLEIDELETQAKQLAKAEGISIEQARQRAVENQRLNKGVTALKKNWADYKKQLSVSKELRTTQDYAKALIEVKDAVKDMVGAAEDIPDEIFEDPKNLELIEKALDGDVKALNQLGIAIATAQVEAMVFDESLARVNNFDTSQFETYKQTVLNGLAELQQGVLDGNIAVGDSITQLGETTSTEWATALNEMAKQTGMTAQEMQALLSEAGVEAKVTTTDVDQETDVPAYKEVAEESETKTVPAGTDEEGNPLTKTITTYRHYTVPDGHETVTGKIPVAQIEMAPDGEGGFEPPQIKYTGHTKPSKSAVNSDKSGGGGTKKSAASHKHSVNRYSNEENTASGLAKVYDRISAAKDHAFGAERIHLMQKELTTLGKLKKAASEYLAAIVGEGNVDKIVKAVYSGKNIGDMIKSGDLGGTIAADFKSLSSGLDAAGKPLEYQIKNAAGDTSLQEEEYNLDTIKEIFKEVGTFDIELDSYGNIKNRDDIMNMLDKWNNSVEDWFSTISDTATPEQENEKARRLAMIEAIRERIEQYGETAELIQDKVDEYLDKIYEMQQKNADIISGKLEKQIRLTENALSLLQNSIKLMGKNMYKNLEAMEDWFAAVWTTPLEERDKSAKAAQTAGEDAMTAWHKWQADEFDTEGINSEQALDIISSSRDAIQEAFDGIFEGIDAMSEHMGNTLDYWNDKIDKVTSAMEANASTLEHLQNVLGLLGRSADYKALGEILQGQLSVAEDQYAGAKAKATSSTDAYNEAYTKYKELLAEDAQEAEWFKENTLDVLQAQMIEDVAAKQAALENVLEKVNAWFENEINRIYQESEDRLTGEWGSFDELDAAMQRQHNLADEYLTKTNQLYETGTLLRRLAQDIDKTDSAAAKAKLKAFSDEIELMKEQQKLNKSDLDIAKARYEVLLAQIALEEAQNAKSTVRLQRDSEGNYGYVYTADQDKVADAEQNLADKQNDLYNLVLGQTQDYNEKIIQHTKERNEALAELDRKWLNGEITDEEEYHRIRQDITDKYNDLLKADYHSYYEAVKWLNQVGAEGQTEAWTNSFSNILYSQDTYAQELEKESDSISTEVDKDMNWLNSQRDYYTEEAKVGNEELKDTIDNVTDANKALLEQLIGKDGKSGLVGGMSSATTAAINLTSAFASQYTQALETARGYQEMLQALQAYEKEIINFEGHDTGEDESGGKTYTAYSKDGAQYTIGSERGIDFIENASKGDTITGGDGSSWVKRDDGSVLISKNGVEYLYGASWPGEPTAPVVQEPAQTATPSLQKGQSVTVKTTATNFTRDGGNGTHMQSWVPGYTFTVMGVSGDEVLIGLNGQVTGWVRKSDLVGFRSGGYTGEFGNDGKLAMLHEKELVLNADDTENFLEAVRLIREISSAIDLRAAASSISTGLNSPYYQTSSSTLEQSVTIHAEFPNATNHSEIEEAFTTLINRAAQYASREKS